MDYGNTQQYIPDAIQMGMAPLNALWAGRDQVALREAQQRDLLAKQLENQKKQQEIQQQQYALKDLAAMDTDPRRQAMVLGDIGKNQVSQAQGQVQTATAPGQILATNAKNQASVANDTQKQMYDTLTNSIMMMTQNGPAGYSMLPEDVRGFLQRNGAVGPKALPALQMMHKKVTETLGNNPETVAKMQVTNANNSKDLQLERMRIDAGKYVKSNSDRITVFTSKLKPEVQLAQINASLSNGTDPVTGERLDDSGRNFWTMYGRSLGSSAELRVPQQAGKINAPEVTGLPAVPTPRAMVPGVPVQSGLADPLGLR